MKYRILLLILAFVTAGCGGKMAVKTGNPQVPAQLSVPAPNGPQAPALVDIHLPITDGDYQMAVSETGSSEVNRHNVESFLTSTQYQYNHSNMTDALTTEQKILEAS